MMYSFVTLIMNVLIFSFNINNTMKFKFENVRLYCMKKYQTFLCKSELNCDHLNAYIFYINKSEFKH